MALRASGCNDKTFEEVLRLTETFLLRRHTTRERTNENETVFAQLCSADPVNPMPKCGPLQRILSERRESSGRSSSPPTFPSRLLDRARYCLEQFELASQGTHRSYCPAGPTSSTSSTSFRRRSRRRRPKKQFGDWVTYLGKDALTSPSALRVSHW